MKSYEFMKETFKGLDYGKQSEKFVAHNKDIWRNGEYIANIEDYKVLKSDDFYSVWNNNEIISVASLSTNGLIDNVWVNSKYRGKKIFSAMLWFFKTRLGYSKLTIGTTHSKDMQEVVKGLSRFKKSWENIVTGDIEPFDINSLDKYYSYEGTTDWRLILENQGKFIDWPMFFKNKSFIYESYFVYLD